MPNSSWLPMCRLVAASSSMATVGDTMTTTSSFSFSFASSFAVVAAAVVQQQLAWYSLVATAVPAANKSDSDGPNRRAYRRAHRHVPRRRDRIGPRDRGRQCDWSVLSWSTADTYRPNAEHSARGHPRRSPRTPDIDTPWRRSRERRQCATPSIDPSYTYIAVVPWASEWHSKCRRGLGRPTRVVGIAACRGEACKRQPWADCPSSSGRVSIAGGHSAGPAAKERSVCPILAPDKGCEREFRAVRVALIRL